MPAVLSIRDVLKECNRLRKEGRRTIDAHIGAPSHEPPIPVSKVLGELGEIGREYTPFVGMEEFREELASYAGEMLNRRIEPDMVLVAASATHALFTSLVRFRGKHGLMPAPGFPMYFVQADLIGLNYSTYDPAHPDLISEVLSKLGADTRFVLVNYPHNPTGHYPERGVIEELYDELRSREILMINDVVYHSIYYEERPSFLGDVLIDSLSKTFSLPGIRLGWVYLLNEDPADFGQGIYGTTAGVSAVSQEIGVRMLRAVDDRYLNGVREYYRSRRDALVERLRHSGFEFPDPKGAFYLLVSHEGIDDSTKLATRLLRSDRRVCVGVVPAISFKGGRNEFRISYGRLTEADSVVLAEELEKELAD